MLVANDWATTQAGVDALQAAGALLPLQIDLQDTW
jgi:hypothetical protein